MKAMIMKGRGSRLDGARCRQCPRPLRAGEAVLYHRLPDAGLEDDRFVVHAACMQALLDRTPEGRPPGDPAAQFADMRRQVAKTGTIFFD